MYKLGITGGIGSGKSTASVFFKKKGAFVIDADSEAKNLFTKRHASTLGSCGRNGCTWKFNYHQAFK